MIEYADPDKVICISDIMYNYNDANPLNDYKVNAEEQNKTAEQVISAHIRQESERIIIETLFPAPFTPGQIDLRPL
jgi:hypothetical protein